MNDRPFGDLWDRLHEEHGRKAVDGGCAGASDTLYLAHGETIADQIERLAGCLANKDVMDYGCGDGRVSAALVKRCKSLVCADASKSILDKCAARVPNAGVVQVEWPAELRTYEPTRQWDVVCASAVLYHLTDVESYAVLAQVHELLKPNVGCFAFDICNLFHPDYKSVLLGKSVTRDWKQPWPWIPQSATSLVYVATQVLGYRAVTRHNPDGAQPWLVCWR